HQLNVLRGPILIPLGLAIVAITIASFFLNAVFAFAISKPGKPEVKPAMHEARKHLHQIAASGAVVGIALAFATTVTPRWGKHWFVITLGIVVGVMMIGYVSVPARLIGVKPEQSTRDKLTTTAVGGAIGAMVSTPPYLLGRIGLLMLGTKFLLIPGIFVFA